MIWMLATDENVINGLYGHELRYQEIGKSAVKIGNNYTITKKFAWKFSFDFYEPS